MSCCSNSSQKLILAHDISLTSSSWQASLQHFLWNDFAPNYLMKCVLLNIYLAIVWVLFQSLFTCLFTKNSCLFVCFLFQNQMVIFGQRTLAEIVVIFNYFFHAVIILYIYSAIVLYTAVHSNEGCLHTFILHLSCVSAKYRGSRSSSLLKFSCIRPILLLFLLSLIILRLSRINSLSNQIFFPNC